MGVEPRRRERCGDLDAILMPFAENRPARWSGGPLKLALFNARGGGSIPALLRRLRQPPLDGAAVLMLCELDWGLRRSGGRPLAADLAREMGYSFAFAPEFGLARPGTPFSAFFGNAILSAVPLERVRNLPLPALYDWEKRRMRKTSGRLLRRGQRAAMTAVIRWGGRSVSLGLAHLENRAAPCGRATQLEVLLGAMESGGPAVVGGDFNTVTSDLTSRSALLELFLGCCRDPLRLRRPQRHEPLFNLLSAAGFEYEEANQPLAPTYAPVGLIPRWMRLKLDWLAARQLKPRQGSARVVSSRVGGRRLSDHDFVVCEFSFE